MAGVSLINVSKQFGDDVVAVDELSFSIGSGSRLAVVGPSGSGKSTLLRLIAGFESPTIGQITLGGKCVASGNDPSVTPAQRNVGMVFQGENLLSHLTVGENLLLGAKLRKIDASDADNRARDAAKRLKIEPLWDRYPQEISGGEAQRVALGRLLTTRPSVWLLDEPAAHVDPATKEDLLQSVIELHALTESTLIYVTHDQYEAMLIGQQVAVLRDGRLEQLGQPQDLIRSPETRFVAGFIGAPPRKLIHAQFEHGNWYLDGTRHEHQMPNELEQMSDVVVGVPSDAVYFSQHPEHLRLKTTVNSVVPLGAHARVTLITERGSVIQTECDSDDAPQPGIQRDVNIDLRRCEFFAGDRGKRVEVEFA